MSDGRLQSTVGSHADPEVAADGLTCRSCGYELTGLATNGLCPECAAPVALSLRGDDLISSDPGWLAQLARGATLVFASACAWTVIQLTRSLAEFAAMNGPSSLGTVLRMITAPLTLVTSVAFLIGLWWLTGAEREKQDRRTFALALSTRAVLLAGLVGYNASLLIHLATRSLAAVGALWVAVWFLNMGWVALLYRLRALARRMGAADLAVFLEGTAWSMALFGLIGGLASAGPLATLWTSPGALASYKSLLGCAGFFTVLVLPVLWGCSLYATYQMMVRLQALQQSVLIARSYLPRALRAAEVQAAAKNSGEAPEPPAPDASSR